MRGSTVLVASALAFGFALAWPSSAQAEYVCFGAVPTGPGDVRGQTWSGRVTAIDRRRDRDLAFITFHVDRVYRDAVRPVGKRRPLYVGMRLRLRSSTCYGPLAMGFRVGSRYLISTKEVLAPRGGLFHGWTVAWQLGGGDARFAEEMYRTRGLPALWPGFARAETVDAALTIVVPPPATDAIVGRSAAILRTQHGPGRMPILLAVGIASAFVLTLRPARRRPRAGYRKHCWSVDTPRC